METLSRLWEYVCLLAKKWVFWVFLGLDAIGAVIAFAWPHLQLPMPVYWALAYVALIWAGFQVYRDSLGARPPSVLETATQALASAHVEERFHAIQTLAQMDLPVAREVLARAAQSHVVPDTRFSAAFALAANFRDPRAVPTLIAALESRSPDIRLRATRSLGEIAPFTADAVLAIADHLRTDNDPQVRTAAAQALAQIADPASVSVLAERLHDDNDTLIHRFACEALAQIGTDEAITELAKALISHNQTKYQCAAKALQQIGTPKAVECLKNALQMRAAFGFDRPDPGSW